jgi:hypothetical protein
MGRRLQEAVAPSAGSTGFYTVAANAWASARSFREREQAYATISELPKKIPITSKLQPKVRELLASVEKKMAEEQQNRLKANVAYKAKAQASGFDEKKGDLPEKAVDGDINTSWSHKHNGEKWLALDLARRKRFAAGSRKLREQARKSRT